MGRVQSTFQDRIQAGDLRGAAARLVVDHAGDVLSVCTAMLRDPTAAEDVTQEVFGDALRGLSTFRGDASPRAWLLAIARNRCIDHLRARRRDPWGGALSDEEADPDAQPDRDARGSEWFADMSLVRRALEVLPEGDRALIVLRFKNGLEYDELASAFGLREGTVRMRVSRALARMRQEIAPAHLDEAAQGAAAPAAPAAASSSRSAAATPAFGAPLRGGAPGAPPPAGGLGAPQEALAAPRAASWWDRLKAWAFGGRDEGAASAATSPMAASIAQATPLGLALAASDPSVVTEALSARLGAMVEGLPPRA
jgi:RNA polymerase sigma-70 factor (ECF subfamily)